jgi:hypothetical protein
MRKLAILAILTVPAALLGAYAFAANEGAVSPDSQMSVNEPAKSDFATANQGTRLFAMEGSEESENEAGPLLPDGLRSADADDEEHEDDND